MLAKYERRVYSGGALVWVGQYRNLKNLPHWHNECELICCNEGDAVISANNKTYYLSKGYCFFCPTECIHNITSGSDTILSVALFDRKLTASVTDYYNLSNPVFKDEYDAENALNRIIKEHAEKRKFYGPMVNTIITELIFKIFRNCVLTKKEAQPLKPTVSRYKKLLELLDVNTDITFEEAARIMNMSEAYFSRFFKSMSGMTYTQYINTERVEKAIDLMNHNPEITSKELMKQTGFGTLRNLNRVFKDITGYSPKNLPDSFESITRTSMQDEGGTFNPTLKESELLNNEPNGEHK